MSDAHHRDPTPTRLRAGPSRGRDSSAAVERHGGRHGGGVIRGVSVVTRGEALGHDNWLDAEFLSQVAAAINARPGGVKSRFAHPSLSGDGLGKFLGRVHDARVEGDRVRADLHLSETAHDAPEGDLAAYVFALAETDPEAFGASIVYLPDRDAEAAFAAAHADPAGRFVSPDQDNARHLPHARLAALRAVDVVDEPAANPGGLFSRDPWHREAEALAAFVCGLTQEAPRLESLSLDPDHVAAFARRFLATHRLKITKEEPLMEERLSSPAECPPSRQPEPTGEGPPASSPADPPPREADAREELRRFLAAFGPIGAEWFAAGLSWDEAKDKQIERLAAQVAELEARLAAVPRGEPSPIPFRAADDAHTVLATKYAALGQNLARLAAQNEARFSAAN